MNRALTEGLRLRAIRADGPVRFRTFRRVPLNPRCLLWTSISLPGDPSVPLGVMCAPRGAETVLHLCDKPLERKSIAAFWSRVGAELAAHIDSETEYVQIAVGANADARHLVSATLAVGKIGPTQPAGKNWNPQEIIAARKAARYLAHPVLGRYGEEMQAALIVLSDELAQHAATPISDRERAHPGVHLAWLDETSNGAQRRLAAETAALVLGDHQPLGEDDARIHEAVKVIRDTGDSSALHAVVHDLIGPLRALHERAYDALAAYPDGGSLAHWLREQEINEFARFRLRSIQGADERDADYRESTGKISNPTRYATVRQRTGNAMRSFAASERQRERESAELLRRDPVARAGGVLEGTVVRGNIVRLERSGKDDIITAIGDEGIGEFEEEDKVEFLGAGRGEPDGGVKRTTGVVVRAQAADEGTTYRIRIRGESTLTTGSRIMLIKEPFGGAGDHGAARLLKPDGARLTPWTHEPGQEPPAVERWTTGPNRLGELLARW